MNDPNFCDARWQKSSYTSDNGGACVEIAWVAGTPGIGDSKLGRRTPVIVTTPTSLAAMLAHVKAGAADLR